MRRAITQLGRTSTTKAGHLVRNGEEISSFCAMIGSLVSEGRNLAEIMGYRCQPWEKCTQQPTSRGPVLPTHSGSMQAMEEEAIKRGRRRGEHASNSVR